MPLQDFSDNLKKQEIFKEQTSKTKLQLYDVVNEIFTKSGTGFDAVSPFYVNRAISMNSKFLKITSVLAKYLYMDKELLYKIFVGVFPKDSRGFGFYRYIKYKKNEDYKLMKKLSKHFHTNTKQVSLLLAVLKHQGIGIKQIKDFFGEE